MAPLYSVVIPVYNSSLSLGQLAGGILRVFREQVQAPVEVIFVDDGSTNPDTWPTLQQLAAQHPEVKAVQLMRNFGKPGAQICGLCEAIGDYVITMDDDLQHRPDDIPLLIAHQQHDAVIAHFPEQQTTPLRKLSSHLKNVVSRYAINKPPHLALGPFKLLKRQVVEGMLRTRSPYPSVAAQMLYVTRDVVNVRVPHGRRAYGKSGFTFWKMLQSLMNMLVNNSSVMLRLVAMVGVLMSVVSFLLGTYFIVRRLEGHIKISGFTTMVVLVLFTSGMVLFSLGIIGEYLIRIINGTEERPAYVVRQRAGRE